MKAELQIDRLLAADALLAIAKITRLRCSIKVGDTYANERASTGRFYSLDIPQCTTIAIEGLQLLSSIAALVAVFVDLRRRSQRCLPIKIVVNKKAFRLESGVEVRDLERFLRKQIKPEGKTPIKRINSASALVPARERKRVKGKRSGSRASLRRLKER